MEGDKSVPFISPAGRLRGFGKDLCGRRIKYPRKFDDDKQEIDSL